MVKTVFLLFLLTFISSYRTMGRDYDGDSHFYFGMSINRFHAGVTPNLQAGVYSYGFNNMADKNVFDLAFIPVRLGFSIGGTFPLDNGFEYELFLTSSSTKSTITYQNTAGAEELRSLKFRVLEWNFLGFRYNFNGTHSVGASMPLTTGKLFYKSEGVANQSQYENYEPISQKSFLTHYSAVELGLNYQINVTPFLTLRYDFYLPIFYSDVITTDMGRFTLSSQRSVVRIMVRI